MGWEEGKEVDRNGQLCWVEAEWDTDGLQSPRKHSFPLTMLLLLLVKC